VVRSEAQAMLREYVKADNLVKHCLATEAIMRELAAQFGEDVERWGMAGLLHDLDFEETKDTPGQHSLKTAEWLKAKGFDDEFVHTVRAHNAENLGFARQTRFEHALAAAESITGLIVATALVYPHKKLASVQPESIIKRMKKKDFARNVDRNVINECSKFGMDLPAFVALSLRAMQGIAAQLGL
jgi:uncharacterized protein